MKRYLSALLLLGACMTFAAPGASAQQATDNKPKKAAKKPAKKAVKKKTEAKKAAVNEDDAEPDIAGSKSVEYHCELGNKLTIYENAADEKHIGLRWKTRLSRLTRVETTTGANRFENRSQGLVWIGIPAKGMLLDAKKGQQLANECKSPEQQNPQAQQATATATPAQAAPAPGAAPEAPRQ
jgi:hypothetical protein